ncbi:hypothetical protein ACYUMT_02910 [Latilactobacillus sakei]|uniref:hypothetical protein n=1 Tax=Latilactobacillus sakei TaxID=1599 RepID=UPI000C1B2079|nr:hypothetical protein CXB68_01785 [Latilactobacillus sakei]
MDQRKLNPQLIKDKTKPAFPKVRIAFFGFFITMTVFNIWLRKFYRFSTLNYPDAPSSFTIVDYGIIIFLCLIAFFYILQKRTQLYRYYKYMFLTLNIFLFFNFIISPYPSLSYLNYGWHFPLHDYFLPTVMPINYTLSIRSSEIQMLSLFMCTNLKFFVYLLLSKKKKF